MLIANWHRRGEIEVLVSSGSGGGGGRSDGDGGANINAEATHVRTAYLFGARCTLHSNPSSPRTCSHTTQRTVPAQSQCLRLVRGRGEGEVSGNRPRVGGGRRR